MHADAALFHWFGFKPVFADLQLYFNRHIQFGHVLHLAFDEVFRLSQFFYRYLENQFVVNLQDHARLQTLLRQRVLDAQHSDFNQVGIAALDGHVDSLAFKRQALIVREHMHIGKETLAPIEGIDIALAAGLVERTLDIPLDAREGFVIPPDKLSGLAIAHASHLRETERGLAVEDRVNDRFGQAALVLRDLLGLEREERSGGDGMDVLIARKSLDQARFVGNVSQDAQLKLRIIGSEQHIAGIGDKGAPDLASHLRADRDVLQVGIARREPSARGNRLIKRRMHAPRDRIHQGKQPIDVGRLELGELAILQQIVHHWMLAAQVVQHIRAYRIAGFSLFAGGQLKFAKENLAQLFR